LVGQAPPYKTMADFQSFAAHIRKTLGETQG